MITDWLVSGSNRAREYPARHGPLTFRTGIDRRQGPDRAKKRAPFVHCPALWVYCLRLTRFFDVSTGMRMTLQGEYEFMRAEREMGEAIRREVKPCAA